MNNKKAQTEILGIAIIVIILVIGGAVMISMSSRNKESMSSSFTDPELAQSFLNTLMNTETAKNIIISDIIKDCYMEDDDRCGAVNCCTYASETIQNALDATLGNWSKSYTLSFTQEGTNPKIQDMPLNSDCDKYSEQEKPGFYYITTRPTIVVMLRICKNNK